jgi:hypothetical protein
MVGSSDATAKDRLYIIINQQLTSSAVDQLKDSQEIANYFAKSLILEYFQAPESPGQLGEFLQSLFSYDSIITPTRELIYWSLLQSDTRNNINILTKKQLQYWLKEEGVDYTHKITVDFFDWWLRHPLTCSDTIMPLVTWSLTQQDLAVKPSSVLLTSVIRSKPVKV